MHSKFFLLQGVSRTQEKARMKPQGRECFMQASTALLRLRDFL
jgi:hypothetical protein